MMRENTAWCSQRGVALVNITLALFAQPGTTLMRPACNARIPARTTGAVDVDAISFAQFGRQRLQLLDAARYSSA